MDDVSLGSCAKCLNCTRYLPNVWKRSLCKTCGMHSKFVCVFVPSFVYRAFPCGSCTERKFIKSTSGEINRVIKFLHRKF